MLMHTLRISSLWLLRLLCVTAVSGTLYIVTISTTLLDRQDVKDWLSASSAYDEGALISALFAEQPDTAAPTSTVITEQDIITPDAIKQALIRTFPASFIEQSFNTVIDKSYDWVEGKEATFSFSVPIDTKRQVFIDELIKEVEPTVAALPLCSPSVNTLCRPNIAVADFTHQIVTDSLAASDFLQTPITEKSFSSAASNDELFSLSQLPVLRQVVSLLLWILPALFIISVFGVWLLSERGTRLTLFSKLSRTVFSSMTLAILLSGAIIAIEKIYGLPIEAVLPQGGALVPIMAEFITEMILAFSWSLLFIAAVLFTFSLAGWITFTQLRKRQS